MLTYNTQLKKIVLPEYGRNIQKMVQHCSTIEDKDERTACAWSIVQTMETLFPPQGDLEEYRRKLWDHLAIMSDFALDIDWPFEVIRPDSLGEKPMTIHHTVSDIKFRQYGRNLETMIAQVSEMEPGTERDSLALLLANQMKKQMLMQSSDNVEDARIFKDLRNLSHGAIDLREGEVQLLDFTALPMPSKKKKKK